MTKARPERTRTLVRLTRAADELSVPRATVRSWATDPNRRLWPVGLDEDDVALYDLADITRLVEATTRRRRSKGPTS